MHEDELQRYDLEICLIEEFFIGVFKNLVNRVVQARCARGLMVNLHRVVTLSRSIVDSDATGP